MLLCLKMEAGPASKTSCFSKQLGDGQSPKKRLWHEIWKLWWGGGYPSSRHTRNWYPCVWWAIVEGKVVPVYTMKVCGVVEVQLHSFLTTVLIGRRVVSITPGRRTPRIGSAVPRVCVRHFWANYRNKFGNVTYMQF